jgi:hypothetical protein
VCRTPGAIINFCPVGDARAHLHSQQHFLVTCVFRVSHGQHSSHLLNPIVERQSGVERRGTVHVVCKEMDRRPGLYNAERGEVVYHLACHLAAPLAFKTPSRHKLLQPSFFTGICGR